MALNIAAAVLDGSILPHSMRSDYGQVAAYLIAHEADASNEMTTVKKGLFAIIRVLIAIFSGDFASADTAIRGFEDLVELEKLGALWPARVCMSKALKLCHEWHPPILWFWEGSGGMTGIKQGYHEQYRQAFEAMNHVFEANSTLAGPKERLEYYTLNTVLTYSMGYWNSTIGFHNGCSRLHARLCQDGSVRDQLNRSLSNRKQAMEMARDLGEKSFEHDFKLLNLQSELGSDSVTWRTTMETWRAEAQSRDDRIDMALMDMMMADKLLSPAFTSPLALNLIAFETANVDCSNSHWDSVEDAIRLSSAHEADQLYVRALDEFSKGEAPRGCGAVMVRQACMLYGPLCDGRQLPDHESLESAKMLLEHAVDLLQCDWTQIQVARCHLVIIAIFQNHWEAAKESASEIGQTCARLKNFSVGRFVANLWLRFARRQYNQHSRIDIALQCYMCAERCFDKLGDQFGLLKALVAQSETFDNVVNSGAALDLVRRHRPMFWHLISELDTLSSSQSSKKDFILSAQRNLFMTYSTLLSRIYLRANDPTEMQDWDATVLAWQERPEVAAHTEQLLLNDKVIDFALGHLPPEERLDVWSREKYETVWLRRYTVAFNRWRRAREDMDLVTAESELRMFAHSVPVHEKYFVPLKLAIIACSEIGDIESAKRLLHLIPWDKLYNRSVTSSYHGPEMWVRPVDTRAFVHRDDVEVTLHTCVMANDWDTGLRMVNETRLLVPEFLAPSSLMARQGAVFRLTHAAIIAMNTNDDETALSLLLEVVKSVESGRSSTTDADSKRGSVANGTMAAVNVLLAVLCIRKVANTFSVPALDALFDKTCRPDSWMEAAILFEEMGKARQLRDLVTQLDVARESRTTQCSSDRELLIQLRRLPLTERTIQEQAELETLESRIQTPIKPMGHTQQLPSYSTSIPKLSELYPLIPDEVLVLSMSFSHYGSMLSAIDKAGVRLAVPIKISDIQMQRLAMGMVKEISNNHTSYPDNDNLSKINSCITKISGHIIAPVEDLLDVKKHLIFVPGQPLTNFPFHILLHRGCPLFLSRSTSLTPSLAILEHQLRNPSPLKPEVSVVCKPNTLAEYTRTGETPIPMACVEAIAIARTFLTWPRLSSDVDRQEFKRILTKSSVVHVGTHGHRHKISPWLAHLSLKDKLYVVDLAGMRNSAALVVFSACLSGRGHATLGNDELGFATAILASGCQCYIGALWEVDDFATLLLMTAFYRRMATRPSVSVAEMLRHAQCELYHMTRDEACKRLRQIQDVVKEATLQGLPVNELVRRPKSLLKRQVEDLPDSLAHPFYWAGFAAVGNALIKFTGQ